MRGRLYGMRKETEKSFSISTRIFAGADQEYERLSYGRRVFHALIHDLFRHFII